MIFKRDKLSAYTIYLLLSGVSSFALYTIFTINMVYQVEIVKLNPLQLVLVGTMLETVAFICQVPTGVLADIYSRRLSVILGYFLIGAGFLLEGLIPRFEMILLAQVIWGLGATFTDGAEQAWLADEMGEEQVGRAFLRSSQVGQIAMLASVPISIGLATIRLNLAIIAGGSVLILLSLFLVLFMPEHGFRPAPREERHSWKTMGRQMIEGGRAVRQSPLLLTILCITLFAGMASEGFDRLQTAHFIKDFVFPGLGQLKPVVWFGIINIVGTLLVLAVTEIVRRRVDTTNHHAIVGTLFAFNLVLIASVVVFGLAGNFLLALAAYWCASVSRRANLPLYMTWLTQNSDSKVRATVISLAGQVDAIGQIAGGPITGLVGYLISIRAAIVSTALMLAPNILFFTRALRQKKDIPVIIEAWGESMPVEAIAEVVPKV
jgi:DHA3 family tetracycline resistance protein-like MFS transporter